MLLYQSTACHWAKSHYSVCHSPECHGTQRGNLIYFNLKNAEKAKTSTSTFISGMKQKNKNILSKLFLAKINCFIQNAAVKKT
jgi:hypothetical protein